jgi:hypothetical protein
MIVERVVARRFEKLCLLLLYMIVGSSEIQLLSVNAKWWGALQQERERGNCNILGILVWVKMKKMSNICIPGIS